jgi:hypothetical protein
MMKNHMIVYMDAKMDLRQSGFHFCKKLKYSVICIMQKDIKRIKFKNNRREIWPSTTRFVIASVNPQFSLQFPGKQL